jgi:HJR/Mrr/RecB family endonuclease
LGGGALLGIGHSCSAGSRDVGYLDSRYRRLFNMGRRRNSATSAGEWKVIFGILALAMAASIVSAIAGGINSSPHRVMREIGLMLVLIGVTMLVGVIRYLNKRRAKTQHRELKDLLALTPRQFERSIALLLRDLGYRNVRHIGGSGDLCADVVAVAPDGMDIVVQCKRHAPGSTIGSPEIQKFIGMMTVHHRVPRGIFVTTAEFSGPAIDLARQHPITLWDGRHLSKTLATLHSGDAATAA